MHRRHAGKTEVRIIDYVDRSVPMLRRMSERRLKGYRAIGYEIRESESHAPMKQQELRIEYERP